MPGEPRPDRPPSDRAVLGLLGIIAAILANLILVMQLFVLKPVFEAKLDILNARMARIESALGLKPIAASTPPDTVWLRF